MAFNHVEELIDDLRKGKMVILMDDEDRENEGDLVIAASCVDADDINFMARYGRGLICLTLTQARCEQLQLPLMVSTTNDKHLTNFTVSIEAAEGVTTGISAADRARTVQAAVAAEAKAEDIVQPGHIFPIMAQPGGVLTRAGHTEAGCDLARLAGHEPAAVIVEILNEDGTMARRPDLEVFAEEHQLKMGTIADLIQYRLQHESTIERVSEANLPTRYGTFRLVAFHDTVSEHVHLALVMGKIDEKPVLVRVHLPDLFGDVLGAQREDCGMPLDHAMSLIAEEGCGVVIILRQPSDNQSLIKRIRDYHLLDEGVRLPRPDQGQQLRTYGLGAQMLKDLGITRMRIIGAPKRFNALAGFGLTIVEYVQ